MTTVDDWLEALDPEQRAQVDRLAAAVRDAEPRAETAVKWGQLAFTVDGCWHHWLCAVAVAKSGVSLTFHKGVLLADPEGILAGTGRYVRRVPHERAVAHPTAVAALVKDAVAHRTEMLP